MKKKKGKQMPNDVVRKNKLLIVCTIMIIAMISKLFIFDLRANTTLTNLYLDSIRENDSNHPYDINHGSEREATTRNTIGYAITITSCRALATASGKNVILDSAAVLKHSIHLASLVSNYDYQCYAFVHPTALNCTQGLSELGYNVQIRGTPIDASIDIQNEDLKQEMNTGCCGPKEFMKLYSLLLLDHPIVVHLDLDTIILKPLDHLFDFMLNNTTTSSDGIAKQQPTKPFAMWESKNDKNTSVTSMFTRDYPMRVEYHIKHHSIKRVAMQGGFWIIKPSQKVFHEMVNIIVHGGNFQIGLGYGGERINPKSDGYLWSFGCAQIQGLLSYYYGYVAPSSSFVELNYCYYNTMGSEPRTEAAQCVTGQSNSECQDCRTTAISDIYTAHYTFCGKPWWCSEDSPIIIDNAEYNLCKQLHDEWYRVRYDLEFNIIHHSNYNNSDIIKKIPKLNNTAARKKYYCPESTREAYQAMNF